jgi:hypothetical protein
MGMPGPTDFALYPAYLIAVHNHHIMVGNGFAFAALRLYGTADLNLLHDSSFILKWEKATKMRPCGENGQFSYVHHDQKAMITFTTTGLFWTFLGRLYRQFCVRSVVFTAKKAETLLPAHDK